MVIAALIVFGTLLAAWVVAPPEPRRRPARALEGMAAITQEGLAEAA